MIRGHAIITTCGACAAIVIGAAPISWANAPSGPSPARAAPHRPGHGPALTKKQIRELAEIQRGAIEAGLHPGVFGPPVAASGPPVDPSPVTHAGSSDSGDPAIEAGGAFALTLIACGGGLIAIRRRDHRIDQKRTL
jgi:hypothetical protein